MTPDIPAPIPAPTPERVTSPEDLWGALVPPRDALTGTTPTGARGNPLVALYGPAPVAGARCGTCVHLLRVRHHDYTYAKCALRANTHGSATDHRVRWPACARYVSVAAAAT
jgi:hypothetical protein